MVTTKTKISIGTLILILLSTGIIYIQLPDKLQIRLDDDKTTFYTKNENNRWIVTGREYNGLFDGTSKMNRALAGITTTQYHDNITKDIILTRTTPYIRGPVIKDTYTFSGTTSTLTMFPVSHTVEIFNASGKFYRYEVRDLFYDGPTVKLTGTKLLFGKNMKVEWDPGYRWAWVYKTGVLKVQYDIKSDYEKYEVRLFDPPPLTGGTVVMVEDWLWSPWVNGTHDWYDQGVDLPTLAGNVFEDGRVYRSFDNISFMDESWRIDVSASSTLSAAAPASTQISLWEDLIGTNSISIGVLGDINDILSLSCLGDCDCTGYSVAMGTGADSALHQLKIYWNATASNISLYFDGNLKHTDIISGCNFNDYMLRTYTRSVSENIHTINLSSFGPNLTFTIEGYNQNISAELGSIIDTKAILGSDLLSEIICVDVDHPSYGINYSCLNHSVIFDLNITWFRTAELSNGTTILNLTYAAAGNKSINISGHQYDEIVNLTLNVTGYANGATSPSDVKVYINGTLAANVGNLFGEITRFNDTTTIKNNTFTADTSSTIGYVRLPKNTSVSAAVMTVTGYNHTYNDDTANNITATYYSVYGAFEHAYEKKDRTFRYWDVSTYSTGRDNITISTENISDGGDWIQFKIHSYGPGSGIQTYFYNGSEYLILNNTYSASTGSYGTDTIYLSLLYDTDYNTGACYGFWNPGYGTPGFTTTCNSFSQNSIIYEESIWWESPTYNPWLEIGNVNGSRDWNVSGLYTEGTVNFTNDMAAKINAYLSLCTADSDGFCDVPITVASEIGGILQVSYISINYSVDTIRLIPLDLTVLAPFLGNSSGAVDIPIDIESGQAGIIEVYDIRYDYAGGNDSIFVRAHTTDYTENKTYYITYYYSDWYYNFPAHIDFIEFIPRSPTQKDVTPYGQTSTKPILNITSTAYGGKTFNFSIQLNESVLCVNDTFSLTSTKASGDVVSNTSWVNFTNNIDYLDSFSIYTWADFECNYTTWTMWAPYWMLRPCCTGCLICDDDTVNMDLI